MTIHRRILVDVALVVLVLGAAAIFVFFKQLPHFERAVLPDLYVTLSRLAAEQVAASLGEDRRTIVVAVGPSAMSDPQAARRASFLDSLKANGVKVVTFESFSIVECREQSGSSWGIPAERYHAVRAQHPKAAVVFLSAMPPLETPAPEAKPAARPRMIAVSEFFPLPNLNPYFAANQLDLAIVFRPDPPVYQVEPETPKEWFEFFCAVLTPETGDHRDQPEASHPQSDSPSGKRSIHPCSAPPSPKHVGAECLNARRGSET